MIPPKPEGTGFDLTKCPRCGREIDESGDAYAHVGCKPPAEPEDHQDHCLVCDKVIPPGPNVCSDHCEKVAKLIEELRRELKAATGASAFCNSNFWKEWKAAVKRLLEEK